MVRADVPRRAHLAVTDHSVGRHTRCAGAKAALPPQPHRGRCGTLSGFRSRLLTPRRRPPTRTEWYRLTLGSEGAGRSPAGWLDWLWRCSSPARRHRRRRLRQLQLQRRLPHPHHRRTTPPHRPALTRHPPPTRLPPIPRRDIPLTPRRHTRSTPCPPPSPSSREPCTEGGVAWSPPEPSPSASPGE